MHVGILSFKIQIKYYFVSSNSFIVSGDKLHKNRRNFHNRIR